MRVKTAISLMVLQIISFNMLFLLIIVKIGINLVPYFTEDWKCLNINSWNFNDEKFQSWRRIIAVCLCCVLSPRLHCMFHCTFIYISKHHIYYAIVVTLVFLFFCYSALWWFHIYTVYISGLFVTRSLVICSLWVWHDRLHYVNSII